MRIRMLGIVQLVDAQYLFAADDDQRLVDGQAQHFVRGQHRAAPDTDCLAVLWGIAGDLKGIEHLGTAGNGHAGDACAGGNIFSGELVGTAKKKLYIAIA